MITLCQYRQLERDKVRKIIGKKALFMIKIVYKFIEDSIY